MLGRGRSGTDVATPRSGPLVSRGRAGRQTHATQNRRAKRMAHGLNEHCGLPVSDLDTDGWQGEVLPAPATLTDGSGCRAIGYPGVAAEPRRARDAQREEGGPAHPADQFIENARVRAHGRHLCATGQGRRRAGKRKARNNDGEDLTKIHVNAL